MANGELSGDGALAPTPRTESFNQIVRGAVVLALVGGMIYGFVVSKVVSTESFLIVANTALVWWFRSRDEARPALPAKPTTPGGTP